jgi:hypothetical protein
MKLTFVFSVVVLAAGLTTANIQAADINAGPDLSTAPSTLSLGDIPQKTVLGGTNWLESIGVSSFSYSNLVSRLLAANSAITNALMLTNDVVAGQALDEALAVYQDLSEEQLKNMQAKLSQLAEAYDGKSQKMEADERDTSVENARLYRGSAQAFERLRDGYRLKANDIQSIRNDIQHNAEQFRQRRDYYISIIQIHAGDQVLEAVSKVVEALREVQGEIATTLTAPLETNLAKK